MARRTKHEMEQMKSDARFYLLQTNNKPQPAFELMVKECLENQESIPYYVKDIKDFIKVSQELALELGRKEQMAKRDREHAMAKETVINYILNLSVNEIKSIYNNYKNTVTQSNKLVLHDVYMMIYTNDMKEEYITESAIRLFSNIMEEESKAIEEIAVSTGKEEINTELKPTINNLISQYPNYNQEDIAALDHLAQFADTDTMALIGKFLHTVYYMDGNNSLKFLNAISSQLATEEEETQSNQSESTQSFSYTVTDNYIPQPLSGTINASSKEEAYELLCDIYTDELGVSESDLEITIKET